MPRARPDVSLFLHLSDDSLLARELDGTGGPVVAEGLGIVSQELIATWLAGSQVVVRPVLDMARADAVDRHDPPSWMREQVVLRDAHCVFPGCRAHARRCDLDHIEPYDPGGPPGQTSPDRLGPLCRGHHRAKTHGDIDYRRLPDGSYRWTLSTGHVVDVPCEPATPVTR